MKFTKSHVAIALALGLSGSAAMAFSSTQVTADVGPDLVISELMINPRDVYDSRGEWIEIANRGVVPANLEGWTLTDERHENVVLPNLPVAPGERLVLTRTADPYVNGGAEPDWVYGNQIVLYNLGDRLILSDADGNEHDRVDWYQDSGVTVPSGKSLALRDLSLDSDAPDRWCASTTIMVRGDLGSPGAPNQCEQSDTPLVITEILQNPHRSSDFAGEFFEVFNPGASEVDMTDWTVKDDDRDRFTIDTAVTVAPGGYAVIGIRPNDNGGVPLDYAYGNEMRLHNDRDELALADLNGVLVDRVAWDDGRTFPDPNGASMSLIDPAADNLLGSNWCAATAAWAYGDKGTPGAPTWCTAPGSNPIVITEIMFDPETPRTERAAEWFELANLGEFAVDLADWTITAGDWKVHTIAELTIEPGEIAVLAASADATLNGDVPADYVFGNNLPLYNRSSRLILKNKAGVIIDRVEWNADRGFPIPSGHSITVGFPSADNALGPNWCESTTRWALGDFGSPGALGSCEAPPVPPSVVITEVMRNPAAVRDSSGEWFEVYNAGEDDVDLRGWSIGDRDSDLHVIAAEVVVPAGGHAVLGRSIDTTRNGGATAAYAFGGSVVLINTDDELLLHDQYGQFVDEVAWTSDAALRPNGASIALTESGWCVSGPQFGDGDLGTPGAPNDCTPLDHVDVVISEVHHDPGAVSDTVGEWFEITNASAQPVDIEGWQIRDDDADRHTIRTDAPWVLQPGQAVVLGRESSLHLNAGAPVDYAYGADFPMVDGADEITLLDADRIWVDRVTWSTSRPLPVAPGASASLRDLSADNAAPSNWCRSVTTFGPLDEYGTPGQSNLCEVPPPTTTATTVPESATTTTTTTTTTVPASTTTTTTTPTTVPEATTPTTEPEPEPEVRPLSNGFGILAIADASCGKGLQLSGSQIVVAGGAHSNGDVKISGSKISFDGVISYGGKANVSRKTESDGLVADTIAVAPTMQYQVADFAPGTAWADSPGYVAHDGEWIVGQSDATPGIHYVAGDVIIDGAVVDLTGLTIVATGTITVSGISNLAPWDTGLPTLLAAGGDCNSAGITLSGSEVEWTGVLAAPNGELEIGGSKIRGGSILAGSIKISGSDIELK